MSTTPKNRIIYTIAENSMFDDMQNMISSATNINQGDLCYYDDSAHLVKTLKDDANGNKALGIARVTIVAGVLTQPYSTATSASEAIAKVPGPVFGVVANMKLKNGDAFTVGCPVYSCTADEQTVSSAGTNIIGAYLGIALTATASSEGPIRLGNRYLVAEA